MAVRIEEIEEKCRGSNPPLYYAEKDRSLDGYKPIELLSIPVRGDQIQRVDVPPRQRGIVVGIDDKDRVVVAFPEQTDHREGYHILCEGVVARIMGRRLNAILAGNIAPDIPRRERGEVHNPRAVHRITIFKMPPGDQATLNSSINMHTYEMGRIAPELFLTKLLTQRLLWGLRAESLEVRYGRPSKALFGIS